MRAAGFGPNPWPQQSWDGRAAMNFVAGGAGAGLLVASGLAGPAPAVGGAPWLGAVPWLIGVALIALGLASVWLEIGRPWRAMNVFLAPRRSWMSREAIVATLLLPCALAAAAGVRGAGLLAALLALAFVMCQGRILTAARGIPAWREAMTLPLIVSTGLAEGAGLLALWWAVTRPQALPAAAIAMALLAALRFAIGVAWTRRLALQLSPRPLAAVNRAGRAFNRGSLGAIALVLLALASPLPANWAMALLALAAALTVAGGAIFKWQLVTRAAFNQGFALPHLPVRGVRR